MNTLKEILLYIWQLPQNLLGLILIAIYKPEKDKLVLDNGNVVYFSKNMPGGISLGKYSIINSYYAGLKTGSKKRLEDSILKELDVVKHEGLGHGTQSRLLGPLYLLVIGLPSIIWAWMYGTIIPYTQNGYYKFYTEKWADSLGGVVRK
jgi:hypothetical protein